MKRDRQHHQALKTYIKDAIKDPFDLESPPGTLYPTGFQVAGDIQTLHVTCVNTVQNMVSYFEYYTISEGFEMSLNSPIMNVKLNTFSVMKKHNN